MMLKSVDGMINHRRRIQPSEKERRKARIMGHSSIQLTADKEKPMKNNRKKITRGTRRKPQDCGRVEN